jgi:hypothetical protein
MVTDALPSALKAFIILAMWLEQTFRMVLCVDCQNKKEYSSWKILHFHLLRKGFMPSYNWWTKHGERGVMMEDSEEEEGDDMYPKYGDTAMGEAEDKETVEAKDEEASYEPIDDLRRAIVDAHREAESVNEKRKLKGMLEDHKKKLYPNCKDGNTKLGITLELLQWKAHTDLSDNGFEKLLKIMKKKLLKDK